MIFSICKNLNSSVFCGENFRKTSKGIFHSLGGSNKPKLLKISNFGHKIELFSWISQKFACVRFPNCTHSLSYTKIGLYPLRLSLDYFFVLRTCWGDGCMSNLDQIWNPMAVFKSACHEVSETVIEWDIQDKCKAQFPKIWSD